MRHAFKIVHASRCNPSEWTPDERAGHCSISRKAKLKECIANVVIAKEKRGIVKSDNFGRVVGLRARSLEGDRLDAWVLLRLFIPVFSQREYTPLVSPCNLHACLLITSNPQDFSTAEIS
jgi:hypothetical protein